MHAANSKVVAARSILIMGGRPVGVEIAGEMVTDFPDKKVKIHFLTF
jgi:NADH dehydrogenase FAD-containing subunit